MRRYHPGKYVVWALLAFEFGRWFFESPVTSIDVPVFACVLIIVLIWNESRSTTQE